MNKDYLPIYIGVFIISLVTISFEVIVNRLFSLTYWYHFAFMIISIALFGIGIGGLLVFFINKYLKNYSLLSLTIACFILSISFPICIVILNNIPLEFELLSSSIEQQKYFVFLFLILSVPFIISGFIFSFLFTNFKEQINKIYFFDLIGGGIGCFFTLIIFSHNGPFVVSLFLSFLTIIASALFLFKIIKWYALIIPLFFILFITTVFYQKLSKIEPRISNAKRYCYDLNKKLYADWDNFGYTAVHERKKDYITATSNYSTYSHIYNLSTFKDLHKYQGPGYILDQAYPFIIRKNPENVAIIGVGFGRDILIALIHGAKNIYGAEYNPTMFNVFMNNFKDFNGNMGHLENVHIYNKEGRYFIRTSKIKYDIIMFDNAIALQAVNSGAFTLAEGYLYTVEAIKDYISKLNTDGILYLSNPLSDYSRFITISREAFKQLGKEEEFKDSIIVINNRDSNYFRCKVIIKNSKFKKNEINDLIDFTNKLPIKPSFLYLPYENISSYASTLIKTKDIEKEYLISKIEIRPSTDDWPFYSQILKKENLRIEINELKKNQKKLHSDFYHSAPFLLLVILAKYIFIFSILFLILPLIFFNLKGFKELNNKFSSIIYFASIGIGFMLIEIVLMQKYMQVLGHPIYSFSVILSALLISSGIGSFISERIKNPYNAVKIGFLGILGSVIITFLFSKFLNNFIINFNFVFRVIIITLLTGINGFYMGFMLPSGIRVISSVENSIPWVWSINCIFSVAASFISIYISLIYGFNFVLFLSIAIYAAGSFLFCYKFISRGPS